MAKTIDIGWIHREFFNDCLVRWQLIREAPMTNLVHRKASDFDSPFLTHNRKRALKVNRTRSSCSFDYAKGTASELERRYGGVLRLGVHKCRDTAGMNTDDITEEPL